MFQTTSTNFAKDATVLITGSTDGIGKETALQLVRMGARVILHGRDRHKAELVREEIFQQTGTGPLDILIADFSSLLSVRVLATEIHRKHPDLRILINNAGLYSATAQFTQDGFEMTFGVNQLAPFLLTNLLLDLLKTNAPSRIINVSSTLHVGAELDFENLNGERSYSGYAAYGTSKLANALFTYELAERLRGSRVTVNCLHPGGVDTKLLRTAFGVGGIPVAQGAETPVYLATSMELQNETGKYFAQKREARVDPRALDEGFRKSFWDYCARLTGIAEK